jgi:uncharacterized protein YidB (DUF937 family)
MGLFDGLLGKLQSAQGAAQVASQLPAIKDALTAQLSKEGTQGITSILDQFKSQGMGNLVQSWLSTGANQPTTAQQITQVLGPTVVNQICQKTGLDQAKVSMGLAIVLPMVIDKLSPKGSLPEQSNLEKGLSMLKGLKF